MNSLEDLLAVADRITVLRQARRVATLDALSAISPRWVALTSSVPTPLVLQLQANTGGDAASSLHR